MNTIASTTLSRLVMSLGDKDTTLSRRQFQDVEHVNLYGHAGMYGILILSGDKEAFLVRGRSKKLGSYDQQPIFAMSVTNIETNVKATMINFVRYNS